MLTAVQIANQKLGNYELIAGKLESDFPVIISIWPAMSEFDVRCLQLLLANKRNLPDDDIRHQLLRILTLRPEASIELLTEKLYMPAESIRKYLGIKHDVHCNLCNEYFLSRLKVIKPKHLKAAKRPNLLAIFRRFFCREIRIGHSGSGLL